MALSEEDKERVKADYLEWSGGDGPDQSEFSADVYLEYHLEDGMDYDEAEAFLEGWKGELEAESARALKEAESDPVVWEGTLDGDDGVDVVRIRRMDEHNLIAEQRNPAYAEGEPRAWEATDDGTAMRVYEIALIKSLGTRGLTR
jgi:hypothetical protein